MKAQKPKLLRAQATCEAHRRRCDLRKCYAEWLKSVAKDVTSECSDLCAVAAGRIRLSPGKIHFEVIRLRQVNGARAVLPTPSRHKLSRGQTLETDSLIHQRAARE